VSDAPAQVLPDESLDERPVSPLLGLLPHFLDTLKHEPALAISLTYLLVAMAGIFYDVSFYKKFDIPVLSLTQLGDFLTAGIQQPMALVLVASTFPICWIFDRINMRYRRKQRVEAARLRALPSPSWLDRIKLYLVCWRSEQVWVTRLGYVGVILAYGWLFVGLYADYRASEVKSGDAAEVRVWLNGEGHELAASGTHPWVYLGAIANYVFVYDREGARSAILPANAVARIEPIPAPPDKPRLLVAPIP